MMHPVALSLCMAALLTALLAPPAAAQVPDEVLKAEAQRIEMLKKAGAATVAIFGKGGQGGGSGVCISPDGYVLSNFHVTSASPHLKVGMTDGNLYDAVMVGLDPTGDVALIKLLGRDDFPHAPLGNSDEVRVGDGCYAIGNPFLLATDFQPTVTYGIVSGIHRYQYPAGTLLEYADCIQADAAINPGNSGGPLFNERGEVIGINGRGSFEKRGRVNVGVGYAISINQIKNFMGYLKSGRIVDHATVGAQVATSDDGRVLVTNILESSDAYRRGLRYGDEIESFGGRRIRTTNALKNVLGTFPKGWRVPLAFRHDGKLYETYVRLDGVHREGELAAMVAGSGRQQRNPRQQPRPGDDPNPRPMPRPGQPKDDDEDKDNEKELPPSHPPVNAAQQKLPEIVEKVYEAREGFANYYFNRINQERIWDKLISHGDFTGLQGAWTIKAEAAGGLESTFELSDALVVATLPGGKVEMPIDSKNPSLGTNLDPLGSGGLFASLHLWRRFLTGGINNFGNLYYLGTVPVPGQDELYDCLVGVYGGVECRLLFEPELGRLAVLEMFPAGNVDPCELHFLEYQEKDGRMVPARIEVRHGDAVFQVYKVNEITLSKAAE